MKRLTLLRHAKSSWSDQVQRDFDRPLNKRGQEAAPIMGAFIAKHGLVPDRILCSSAVRTRETLDLILPRLRSEPVVEYRDDLYLADPRAMLSAVRDAEDSTAHILMIAHNPGLEMLAQRLADMERSDVRALARIGEKFPTASIAAFKGPDSWRDFDNGNCILELFATPKDIAE